jgi:hypothetical protein
MFGCETVVVLKRKARLCFNGKRYPYHSVHRISASVHHMSGYDIANAISISGILARALNLHGCLVGKRAHALTQIKSHGIETLISGFP